MKSKKLAALVSAAVLTATAVPFTGSAGSAAAAVTVNYGEALQKSMFFYEVQMAGKLPEWNMVTWRADSMLTDKVQGGWFDAGDHFKFTLTNAFTATLLAWGYYAYPEAVAKAGLKELYLNNLKWGLDYVMACDEGSKVIGTIGADGFDHKWWGSAEVYERKLALMEGTTVRPYDEMTCTTTVADMAAALAAGYLVFKDENPSAAKEYLTHAKDLYSRAVATWSNKGQGMQKTYYNIEQSGKDGDFVDELMFTANWLYMATGDQSYLDQCETKYIPLFPLENQSTERKFTWGYCWDDTSQAAALLYAINTGKEEWVEHVKKHLEYWTTGYGGKQVAYTPDGLAFLTNWGATRHVSNTAFLAKLACDTIYKDDSSLCSKYNDWAKGQLDYIFGDNKLGLCYVLGMGAKNANSWHHRTSSGVWDDKWSNLGNGKEYAHVLYGALEGGPSSDGSFKDDVGAYENTEVAIDYNAGYTALLCAMLEDYGGKALADFPPVETPKWDEFLVRASINQAGDSYTEIKAFAMNHSAWPCRVIKDLSYNYYFDISELIEQGCSADDIEMRIGYDQHAGAKEGTVSISGPFQYSGTVYYVKITFDDGRVVMPTGQSEHRSECQFRIGVSDNLKNAAGNKVTWDSTNDYSFDGLKKGSETDMVDAKHITMYDGDKLIWGIEPDGTEPEPYTVPGTTGTTSSSSSSSSSKSTTETTATTSESSSSESGTNDTRPHYGDVDCNGEVELQDAVQLCKAAAGIAGAELSVQGRRNADVTGDNTINSADTSKLLSYLAGIITVAELAPSNLA